MCHITPLPPRNGHLSTKTTFFRSEGGRCGEVRLYYFLVHAIISAGSLGKSTSIYLKQCGKLNFFGCKKLKLSAETKVKLD